MAITSFRDLLAWLDARGDLAHVGREVSPRHELVSVLRRMQKGPNRPLLFGNVAGTPLRVATNVLARRETLAASLGLTPDTVLPEMAAREGQVRPWTVVADAPVQQVVVPAEAIDVARDVPQVVHSERDAGAYVTAGIFLARDPRTATYNASWNRTQLVGGDRMRVRMMPPQHLGQYPAGAEAADAPLPVALVIGAPPALMLAAASKIPYDADELETAGAWQGQSLRVVPAKTVDLMVPADAEMVIEGHVLPHVREQEGPFGEFMDSYVEVGRNHVFRATALTRRSDAIYHCILAGGTEDLTLLGLMLRIEVHKRVAPLARIRDIGTPGQILGCVVAIEKESDAQVRAVMETAMTAHAWMKFVVVVDADVDPHDADDVLWAVHVRCRPDTGLLHLPGVPSFPRKDVEQLHMGKVAIDATMPMVLRNGIDRRRFPGTETIRLEDYVDDRGRSTD